MFVIVHSTTLNWKYSKASDKSICYCICCFLNRISISMWSHINNLQPSTISEWLKPADVKQIIGKRLRGSFHFYPALIESQVNRVDLQVWPSNSGQCCIAHCRKSILKKTHRATNDLLSINVQLARTSCSLMNDSEANNQLGCMLKELSLSTANVPIWWVDVVIVSITDSLTCCVKKREEK